MLGAKAGVGGDAALRLADGAGAEDGFGRQAEEDVCYVGVGKATNGRRFCSCLCSFPASSILVHIPVRLLKKWEMPLIHPPFIFLSLVSS